MTTACDCQRRNNREIELKSSRRAAGVAWSGRSDISFSASHAARHNASLFTSQPLSITFTRLFTSAEEGGYVFGAVCLSVCLSVRPSDYSQTCARILTKFFVGVGHGGDPDHASDPGVQSPKSGSSGSAEVCGL